MDALGLILLAGAVVGGTGLLALCFCRAVRLASMLPVLGAVAGGFLGLWGAAEVLLGARSAELSAAWEVPGGAFVVGVDPLSTVFLAPLFAIGALCAVYGRAYVGARPLQLAGLNLLLASMALVLVARHALLFLVAWEVMTLLAYVLITTEHGEPEVRRAGWVYLIASHFGVLALFALFLTLGTKTGGALDFASFSDAWRTAPSGTAVVLALALVGFGVKAGLLGLHVWLPEAHAAAPSHLSALMSAVLIKLGLYGILRTAVFVSPGTGFGGVLMVLGGVGALSGIVLAFQQRDLKRILAYSSIENMGLILLGLGLGFWADARGDSRLAAVAFAGGFLHIWNHAAMKALMFLGAGSVVHGTGTKDLELMGGLLGKMRWTGAALIVGAVGIAGLPPLAGFTGEWLLYRGLTELGVTGSAPSSLLAMSGAATLALVGAIAALCFVRLLGVVLLGTARSEGAAHAHESPAAMTIPLGVLAVACLAGGVAAPALVSLQGSAIEELGATSPLEVAAAASSLAPIAWMNVVLLAVGVLAVALVVRRVGPTRVTETWGCGYAAPTSRMQYTGAGFSELFSMRVLPRWLRSRLEVRAPEGAFPASATFASDATDPLTRGTYEPLVVRAGDTFARLRFLQQGSLHVYLLYILVALSCGFAWVAIRDWLQW